jgi:hypothetical protein
LKIVSFPSNQNKGKIMLKKFIAGLLGSAGKPVSMGFRFKNRYQFECRDKDGNLRWAEDVFNLTTTAGATDVLAKYFKGSAYTAAFYVGLKGTGTAATGDTMASHAGWAEMAGYSETVRQTLTLGAASAGSVDNAASKAIFSINAGATIDGAFVATDSTKSGTTGTLFGAATFSGGSRAVLSGDTLTITVTLTAS